MEKKTTIRVPEAYVPLLEDIRLLTADQNNPNRTTIKQQTQIWRSLQKYGWTYPIQTNKDGVLVDGEQRQSICITHGEFLAPVLRLPVSDVDRRVLRQILNKLKGKHNSELDNEEYIRIMQAGEKDDLKALLESVGERLPKSLNQPLIVFDEFTSVVDREIAKVSAYAISKAVRRSTKKFIAVTCHFDIVDWLEPDWVFCTDTMEFSRKKEGGRPLNSKSIGAAPIFGRCFGAIII